MNLLKYFPLYQGVNCQLNKYDWVPLEMELVGYGVVFLM
jgi:hypothetical protein